MKKWIVISLLVFLVTLHHQTVLGAEYHAYQEITFEIDGMYLLEDWPKSEYKKQYKHIKKRRFWGWNTHTAYSNEKAYFIKETMYVIENEGESPIQQTLEFKVKEETKKQYGASGDIGINTTKKKTGFKLDLESKIKGKFDVSTTKTTEEKVTIRIHVDQNTRCTILIQGEGTVTNGVAKYYRFFKQVRKGGFEIFVVTTEYYSIVKENIDETE